MVPSAVCPHCGESAFSSAEFNQIWTCPYCGKPVIPQSEHSPRGANPDLVMDDYSRFWTVIEDETTGRVDKRALRWRWRKSGMVHILTRPIYGLPRQPVFPVSWLKRGAERPS